VLHINTHAFLVHPALAIVRVTPEVRWVLLPGRCRFIIPLVRPELITVLKEIPWSEKQYKREV
jgi:hypothetical protein